MFCRKLDGCPWLPLAVGLGGRKASPGTMGRLGMLAMTTAAWQQRAALGLKRPDASPPMASQRRRRVSVSYIV